MQLFFSIPGKPGSKQRPRMAKTGHVFTPDKTVQWENHIMSCFAEAHGGLTPLDCPVKMTVVAYWPIPKSGKSKTWRERAAYETTPRPSSPDWDNVGKAVSDALNNIAYVDDRQIVCAKVKKLYSDRPRVDVWIDALDCIQPVQAEHSGPPHPASASETLKRLPVINDDAIHQMVEDFL